MTEWMLDSKGRVESRMTTRLRGRGERVMDGVVNGK